MKHIRRLGLVLAIICMAIPLFSEPVELIGGNLKLVLHPKTGTFCLYHIADTGKNRYEPLIEDRNFGTTSWLSVQINDSVFKLAPRTGKPVEAVRTANGAMFKFLLTDDFYIEQEFSLVDPDNRGFPTAVAMEIRVENTSGKTATFALKGLFDTMLGETQGIHFYTDTRNRISAEERIIPGADRDSVLITGNEQQNFVFQLRDGGVTVPSALYIANWERLNTLSWLPDFLPGRSFNTLYSVQDSAVLFVWPTKNITANALYTVRMLFGPYRIQDAPSAPDLDAGDIVWSLDPSPKTEDERLALIEQILARIDQIELDPSIATDEELDYLNRTLDSLLEQKLPE